MNRQSIEQVVEAIKLPFGLHLKFYVEGNWVDVGGALTRYMRYFIRVRSLTTACNVTGKQLLVCQGRRWELSEHMLPGEIVGTVWLAVQTYVEHELREQFTYKGATVYGPHMNVDKLVDLALSPDGCVEREH